VLRLRVFQQYSDAGLSIGGQRPVQVGVVKPRVANRSFRRADVSIGCSWVFQRGRIKL
jgi:hypothetical protein